MTCLRMDSYTCTQPLVAELVPQTPLTNQSHAPPCVRTALCVHISQHLHSEAQIIVEKQSVIIGRVYISYRGEDNRHAYKMCRSSTARGAQSGSLQHPGTDQTVSPAAHLPFTAYVFRHKQTYPTFLEKVLRQATVSVR